MPLHLFSAFYSAFLRASLKVSFLQVLSTSAMHFHIGKAFDFQVSSPDSLTKVLELLEQSFKGHQLTCNALLLLFQPFLFSLPALAPIVTAFILLMLVHISSEAIELHICFPALCLSPDPYSTCPCPLMSHWAPQIPVCPGHIHQLSPQTSHRCSPVD